MGLWINGHNLWILQCENVDQRMIGKIEQQQPTVFLYDARMAKFYYQVFLQHHKSWKLF